MQTQDTGKSSDNAAAVSKRPIQDEIVQALSTGDLDILDEIVKDRALEALHIRAVLSTASNNAVIPVFKLQETCNEVQCLRSYFRGPNLFFISAGLSLQAHISNGKSTVLMGTSVAFDSNVAEAVRIYVKGGAVSPRDLKELVSLFSLKRRIGFQFDISLFLLENIRLTREDNKNRRPIETLLAFRQLDFLDWGKFDQDSSSPSFNHLPIDLKQTVEAEFVNFMRSDAFERAETRAMFNNALLTRLSVLWLRDHRNPMHVLSALVDFCIFKLQKLPVAELRLIWHFLKNPRPDGFFAPLVTKSTKLIGALRGMSWDMQHLRALESSATASESGSFFIPFVASFDEKWRNALAEDPADFMVIDDMRKSVSSGRYSDREFNVDLVESMNPRCLAALSSADVERRRRISLSKSDLHLLSEEDAVTLAGLVSP